MYVRLSGDFIDKTKKKANKTAVEELGIEAENDLLYPETEKDKIEVVEITDKEIVVDVTNELGFFSFSIPITTEILENLLSVVIKRMNKIKTMLESLK